MCSCHLRIVNKVLVNVGLYEISLHVNCRFRCKGTREVDFFFVFFFEFTTPFVFYAFYAFCFMSLEVGPMCACFAEVHNLLSVNIHLCDVSCNPCFRECFHCTLKIHNTTQNRQWIYHMNYEYFCLSRTKQLHLISLSTFLSTSFSWIAVFLYIWINHNSY